MKNNKTNNQVCKLISLEDENYFEFLNGLWTGKKPPFSKAIVIRNTNFSNNGKVDHSKIAVLDVESKQLENRTLQNHDIIIERSGGGPKQPVGRVVLFEKETDDMPYSFSNFTSVIRVKDKKKFDPIFVFYYLFNFYKEGKTDKLQRRTTGIRNLDFNSYKNSVILPNLNTDEQKEISKILTATQDAIAGQEELIEKLKKLKKSMMQHLFTHGIKNEPTKMTEIGEIPESWGVEELGNVFKFSSGKSRPQNTSKNKTEMNIYPVYGGNGILGYSSENLFQEQKLIIGRVGEYCGCVEITKNNSWISDNALYSKEISKNIDINFYKFLLSFWNLNRFSNKMGQPLVTQGILSKVNIPEVNLEEQRKISSALITLDKKVESAQEKLSAYQKLFKTLLHELMSGERRVA